MPTKKSKPATKAARAENGPQPPYGPPIRDAIARGNVAEMKRLAARTRKYIADLDKALKVLEGKISKYGS
jgi:hypothetical protein